MKPAIYTLILIIPAITFAFLSLSHTIDNQQAEINRLRQQLEQSDQACVSKAGQMLLKHKREFHAGLMSMTYMEVE